MESKNKIEKFLGFLIGLSVSNNVMYAFKINNTYINFSFIVSVITFVYLIFIKKKKIFNDIKKINGFMKLFIIFILISGISMLLVCTNKNFYSSYISGIIYFIIGLTLYLNVFMLKENKKSVMKGIVWGFILNVLLSFIQYVTYLGGNCFSLFEIFPQNAFQVCNYRLKSSLTMYISSYRAQGIFLETSYYMAYIASTILIFGVSNVKYIYKTILLIICTFCVINSSSATVVLIIFSVLIYCILNKLKFKEKEDKSYKMSKSWFITILLVLLVFICVIIGYAFNDNFKSIVNLEEIFNKLQSNFKSANLNDESNSERAEGFENGLSLIKKYPIGVGYNLMTKVMQKEFEGEMRVYTTYNYLITLCIEIGVVGAMMFVLYILNLSYKLIWKGKSKEKLAIGISALCTFIGQVACGFNFILIPYVMLIYGLADLESRKEYE